MTDSQEQEVRAKLQESKDFLKRQQLLKALWKIKRRGEESQVKDEQATPAA